MGPHQSLEFALTLEHHADDVSEEVLEAIEAVAEALGKPRARFDWPVLCDHRKSWISP